jgi:class 3 adenylate cyclase
MTLRDDLETAVKKILRDGWSKREGQVVPEPEDLGLGNDAVHLEATILYADMSGSTALVDENTASFAAEVYKTYLASAARIIKDANGSITAYDGDRIMAVFIGKAKNTTAAETALKISWAVTKIVNPAIQAQYGENTYQMKHCIGIDTSPIMVSRIGVRNDNDVVWVGRAANYAAKLSSLDAGYVYVTNAVFEKLADQSKYGGDPRRLMWDRRIWKAMNDMTIYRSRWIWPL